MSHLCGIKIDRIQALLHGAIGILSGGFGRDVKRSNENPSIGILLCESAKRQVVEYALSRSLSPTMIAEYKRQLIPKDVLQRSLDEFCSYLENRK